jgi:ketosteroid isomerase-like protein
MSRSPKLGGGAGTVGWAGLGGGAPTTGPYNDSVMPTRTTTAPAWIDTLFDKIYAAYNGRDASATADCYAPDVRVLVNGEAGPADRAALVEALQEQWVGFPDVSATETHRLILGEEVVTEMVIDGHNTGPFLARPATGKAWHVQLAWVCRVHDGRVAELRVYVDNSALQDAVAVAST